MLGEVGLDGKAQCGRLIQTEPPSRCILDGTAAAGIQRLVRDGRIKRVGDEEGVKGNRDKVRQRLDFANRDVTLLRERRHDALGDDLSLFTRQLAHAFEPVPLLDANVGITDNFASEPEIEKQIDHAADIRDRLEAQAHQFAATIDLRRLDNLFFL